MDEKALTEFLQERGGKPDAINEIVRQLSPLAIQKHNEKVSHPISLEEAERIASTLRMKFVERIKINEKGGIAWDDIKNQLG